MCPTSDCIAILLSVFWSLAVMRHNNMPSGREKSPMSAYILLYYNDNDILYSWHTMFSGQDLWQKPPRPLTCRALFVCLIPGFSLWASHKFIPEAISKWRTFQCVYIRVQATRHHRYHVKFEILNRPIIEGKTLDGYVAPLQNPSLTTFWIMS